MHKTGQSGAFLPRLSGPILKTGFTLMGNLLKLLAKNVLISLGLTASASITDAAIQKETSGSGTCPSNLTKRTTIISDEKMIDIMKIVKSLEESGLLIKGVPKTVKNKAKEQKGGFLGILLDTLGASLLGHLLTSKGTIAAGEGIVRAGQDF